MGAALTYARRYALFTLVGIAEEDDLGAGAKTVADTPSRNTEKVASEDAPTASITKSQTSPPRHRRRLVWSRGKPKFARSARAVLAGRTMRGAARLPDRRTG
jgi:hypothetical protein